MHSLPGYFSGKYGISSGAGISCAGSASSSPVGVDATELFAVLAPPVGPSSFGEDNSEPNPPPPDVGVPAVGEDKGRDVPPEGLLTPAVVLEVMVVATVLSCIAMAASSTFLLTILLSDEGDVLPPPNDAAAAIVAPLSLIIVDVPTYPDTPVPAGPVEFAPPPDDDIFSRGMKSFFGRPGPRRSAAADGLPPPRPNRTGAAEPPIAGAGEDTDDGDDEAGDEAFEEEDDAVPLLSVTRDVPEPLVVTPAIDEDGPEPLRIIVLIVSF